MQNQKYIYGNNLDNKSEQSSALKQSFTIHPNGFKVFLEQEKVIANDEYKNEDPYSVEENINSEFHIRRKELTVELLQEVVFSLKANRKFQVLDLGCGQGHITNEMHKVLDGHAEFSGLDYSISAIAYAHEHFPEIDFVVGDVYDMPYANEFFDVIVCNNLWEHVPNPLFLLEKIKKTLKPNGFLIISTPSRYRTYNLVRILLGKPVVFMSKHHVTEYTVGQVIEQLAYGNFEIVKFLSKPISNKGLKAKLAYWVFFTFVYLVKSHHHLEATVFYLAKNNCER